MFDMNYYRYTVRRKKLIRNKFTDTENFITLELICYLFLEYNKHNHSHRVNRTQNSAGEMTQEVLTVCRLILYFILGM